eukprot:1179431-Prorocentrum_minimum.AAC.3
MHQDTSVYTSTSQLSRGFLDVARPPSPDPPPGGSLRSDLKSSRASERGWATSRKEERGVKLVGFSSNPHPLHEI